MKKLFFTVIISLLATASFAAPCDTRNTSQQREACYTIHTISLKNSLADYYQKVSKSGVTGRMTDREINDNHNQWANDVNGQCQGNKGCIYNAYFMRVGEVGDYYRTEIAPRMPKATKAAVGSVQAGQLVKGECVMGKAEQIGNALKFTHSINVYRNTNDTTPMATMAQHDSYYVNAVSAGNGRVQLVFAPGFDGHPDAGKVYGWVDQKDLAVQGRQNCE